MMIVLLLMILTVTDENVNCVSVRLYMHGTRHQSAFSNTYSEYFFQDMNRIIHK